MEQVIYRRLKRLLEENENLLSEKIILDSSIKLDNIYFSYNNDENYILKNISLEILISR